jgi:hypothetical protein
MKYFIVLDGDTLYRKAKFNKDITEITENKLIVKGVLE